MAPRFEKNAPGDFYIVDQCCLTCGVMHDVAPDLIVWDHVGSDDSVGWHCYVARQPETPDETVQMLHALNVMDLDCLRYGGKNTEIIALLVENGHSEQCDVFGPGHYRWLSEKDD